MNPLFRLLPITVLLLCVFCNPAQSQNQWNLGLGSGLTTGGYRSVDFFYSQNKGGVILDLKSNALPALNWQTEKENFTSLKAGYMRDIGYEFNVFGKAGPSLSGQEDRLGMTASVGVLYRLNVLSFACEVSTQKDVGLSAFITLFNRDKADSYGPSYGPTAKRTKVKRKGYTYYLSNVTRDVHRDYSF